jgi:hypothetical protein
VVSAQSAQEGGNLHEVGAHARHADDPPAAHRASPDWRRPALVRQSGWHGWAPAGSRWRCRRATPTTGHEPGTF